MTAARESRAPAHPRLRLALFGGAIAAAAVGGAIIGAPSGSSLRDSVDGLGAAGPLAFVVIYAALTVGLIPGAALSLASGAIFGVALGSVVTVVGASLGATGAFAVGRRLSRDSVKAIAGKHVQKVDDHLSERGLLSVLLLRLVPLVPFNALNYAAGSTALRLRDYVIGTAIGIVPGSVAFTAAGAGATEPGSPTFIAAVAGLALLTAGGALAARRLRRTGTPE